MCLAIERRASGRPTTISISTPDRYAWPLRGGDQLDLQPRVLRLQLGERRNRVFESEGLRAGQPNRPGQGRIRMCLDATQSGLDVLGDRQQLTPGGTELPPVGGRHEHSIAVRLLERGDAPGHSRVIESEAVRRGRELPQSSDGKQSQQILGGDLRTGTAWCIGSHSVPILSAYAHINGAE